MKQILFLIILILYSVLQARRKAMREKQRREQAIQEVARAEEAQRAAAATAQPMSTYQPQPTSSYQSQQVDTPDGTDQDIPPEIQALLNYTRQSKQDENVVTIVEPSSEAAYEVQASTKSRAQIMFDHASLRTFFVTREVLGPPRSRKHFRPSRRGQE